ncbi:MAG: hypothetical protein JO249_19270 [Acidobacteria bacterium]|nr:hypothetical protein [Acidobacteriota bacterium]
MRIRELLESETLVVSKTEFRNNLGVLIGTTKRIGRKIEARDRNGRLVGTFEIDTNITRNWNGIRVGSGDLLSSLFLTFTKK